MSSGPHSAMLASGTLIAGSAIPLSSAATVIKAGTFIATFLTIRLFSWFYFKSFHDKSRLRLFPVIADDTFPE